LLSFLRPMYKLVWVPSALIWTKENKFVCSFLSHYVWCRHNPTLFDVNKVLKADRILPFPHTRGLYNAHWKGWTYPSSQQLLITLLLCKERRRSQFFYCVSAAQEWHPSLSCAGMTRGWSDCSSSGEACFTEARSRHANKTGNKE